MTVYGEENEAQYRQVRGRIGCGIGLLRVQLALNGATHVCAIDLEKHTVASVLASAFANGVVDRGTAQSADLYP